MNKRELASFVNAKLRLAAGYDGDAIASNREMALNYYFQRPRGDEIAGRSTVVSGDVSSMIEATLAQAMNAFMSRTLASYDAMDAVDSAQAKLESETANYLIMGRNNGFYSIAEAVKNALMLRNGLLKVYVERRLKVRTFNYSNVAPEAAAELTAPRPGVEYPLIDYSPKTGKLKFKTRTEERKFCVYSVDSNNFLYDPDWDSPDLQDIPFCAERFVESRAEMVARGFDAEKVYKLPRHINSKSDQIARRPRGMASVQAAGDASQEQIEWYQCYVLVGAEDGTAERHRVSICKNTILEDVEYEGVPYASGCVFINPQMFTGISQFDKLKVVQDINTALIRAMLDNINTTNKNRTAYVSGKVNEDDLTDGRINGNIRVKAGVQNIDSVLKAFNIPDTSGNIVNAIEFMNRRRSEQGGSSLDLATAQMQLNDRVGSQGLDRAYSSMESLTELMVRTIACTLIRSLYLIAHRTLRSEYSEAVPLQQNGRWISSIPAKWPAREAVTVNPGMSPGERMRRSAAMLKLIDLQMALAREGMEDVLVNTNAFYEAVLEWAQINDVPNPERFILDPTTPEAKNALSNKSMQAQAANAKKDALLNQAIALEQLRTAFEKYKQDTELQFKYWAKVKDVEVAEAQIVGKVTGDLLKEDNDDGQEQSGTKEGGATAPSQRNAEATA